MTGSIQKKGKRYYIVFRLPGSDGKMKQKWISAGTSKREAEKKLTELMGEVHNGTYKEVKKITFAKYCELWINSYAKIKTKPSTLRSYQNIINKHLIPVMGDYYLTELDTARLQRYVAIRLEKVKPKTVVNELVPLKKMFKQAVIWGYIKVNPAENIERPRIEKDEMEILTPNDINLFLEHVTPKYKTFFLTAILTGMRMGELLGLQWGDINWNNNQIHVRRSRCNVSKKYLTPKTKNSIRKIDMTPTLVKELKKHKISCPISDLDLVFCNDEGKSPDPDSLVKRQFLPALRRAKIMKVRFHDLRHTNVALRIEQGQNFYYISKQIGHAYT